ncbi:MAG: RHS repeat-associated core domain-containing protein [Nitrospirae bacterium]|nr:RHS repeat-associated core domain-containing protein [Nitrospirota bacterium]
MKPWRRHEGNWSCANITFTILILGLLVTGCEQSKPSKGSGDVSAKQATEQTKRGGDMVGLTWQWRYDPNGRLSEIEAPGNVTTRVTYTNSEAKAGKAQTSTIEFDGEKRTFTWDPQDRLVSAEGSGGTVAINHNAAGLPAEVRSGGAPTIRYGYDVQDRLIETRIGDGAAIRYHFDYLGRLAAIVTPAGEITYSYDRAENRVVRRLPNGVQTIRGYDDEGKLIALTHVDAKNFIIAKYAYTYRPDGLIGEITEKSQRSGEQIYRYEYDLMQRLTGVKYGGEGRSVRYGYDSLGNLAESQTAGGPALRFTSTPAGALATDSRGATRTDERGHIRQLPDSPSPIDYTFNGAGELSVAVANGKKLGYAYNALGLLTARRVDGRETRYLPDPFADVWHPLWQRDPEGKETVTVWDGAVPLVELQGKEVRFRLEDHLGSVRMEVDNSGRVAAWHDYTPYGVQEKAENGGDLSPGFAGLFWDPAAKVYHAMARAYDPVTARFLQPDPQLRVPGVSKHSHSLYAYTGGDPVNFVDRNGAEAESSSWKWSQEYLKAYGSGVKDDVMAIGRFWSLTNIGSGVKYGFTFRPSPGTLMDRVLKPQARPQEYDRDFKSRDWIVNTLEAYQEGASLVLYDKPWADLTAQQRTEARKLAVDTFADDHSSYGFAGSTIGENAQDFNRYMGNTQIWTQYGWTSADWLTTIADSKNKFTVLGIPILPRDPEKRYTFGKTFHNTVSPWLGIKEFPQQGNEYPQSDLNAARLVQDLYNPNQSFRQSFSSGPPKPSSTTKTTEIQPGAKLRPEITHQSKELSTVIMHQIDTMSRIQQQYDTAGGTGRVAGPGGYASPQAHQALDAWQSSKLSSPSRVGGVRLGGAGKALEGFGQLKGIAVDEATGKLVLIGSDEQKMALPPLRLDDVVMVFRAVYNHGQSPSVTIDPDETNPKGPKMDVKHGPGTDGTYVGWILFECDRIMKTYQLGEDNVTHEIVRSRVPGYAQTLDAVFFADAKQTDAEDSNWERFWIVPASVRRFDAVKTSLSLFELPLKVNTQKMRLKSETKNGKKVHTLEDDENGKSSTGAIAFTNWFSKHYDEIADEVRLTPPPGNGFEKPVAIFHELRRIALITAVAERLRDLGEPMPLWMRDYPIAPFAVEKTTPSLTVEKKKEAGSAIRIANIYGGVNLAPADRDVYTYSNAKKTEAKPVRPEDVKFVNLSREEATQLTPKITELARVNEPIGTVHAVTTQQGKKLSVAIMPGAQTRALAPNRQEVTDMVVPIGLGRSISLTRYYNSFFDPAGAFGKGWTLNLPELLDTPVPVKRDGKRSEYRVVQHLVSPLGTVDARFDERKKVEPYGIEMPVAKNHPEIAGIAGGESQIVGTKISKVLFRDGTEWHFDADGRLVLMEADGAAIRYLRDSAGRVQQIVGYVGTDAVAEIRLGYDQQGRVVEAKAKQVDDLRKQAPAEVSKVTFEFGEDGRLHSVLRLESKKGAATKMDWAYSYEANHLATIGGADRVETSFGYDAFGQLLWKKQGDRKTKYTVTTTPQGTTLTKETGEADTQPEKWTYDGRMRPVKADIGGARTIRWRYGKDKEATETLSQDGEPILTRSTSQDGRTETTVFTGGPTYELRKDASGHPITLFIDGAEAAKISWHEDGTLSGLRANDTEIQPLRHQNGWPNGVVISAPRISGQTSEWLQEEWDVMGRPIKITDSSGFEYKLGYDDQGRLRTFGRLMKDGKLMGTNLVYDDDGLVKGIDSSWGKEKREYGNDGVLKSVKIEKQGGKSATTYDKYGRPVSHSAFDGGATTWHYDPDDAGATLRTVELPNGKRIDYSSEESGETRRAQANLESTVVDTVSDKDGRVTTLTWGEKVP